MPVTDVTTHAVCAHQDRLEAPLPRSPFRRSTRSTSSPTRRGCSSTPRAAACRFRARTSSTARARWRDVLDRVAYPAVVKPVRSRMPTERRLGVGRRALRVLPRRARSSCIGTTTSLAAHPSLIQERIVGPGVGVFVLFDRGTARRRLRAPAAARKAAGRRRQRAERERAGRSRGSATTRSGCSGRSAGTASR